MGARADSDVNPYNPDGALTDTSAMRIPHCMFRGELGVVPRTVRAQPAGDLARAEVVGEHVRFLVHEVIGHHDAEDAILWPLLHERVEDQGFQETVAVMEGQHHEIHQALRTVLAANRSWTADPSAGHRDALAEALDRADQVLREHFEAEETLILPVAARTVSTEEWAALVERGLSSIPRTRRSLSLGAIHYYAPPQLWRQVASSIPWFMRPLAVRQGDKAFRKTALAVHGTITPMTTPAR